MKKKNTLFKSIAIMFLVLVVLSWIIPTSRVSGTEVISSDLARVSLHQLFEYPWAGPQASAKTVLFILAVGGFYGVLGITGKYRNCLEKIASFFNIFDFLNIKCISPFHFCKEKEPDFGSFVCTS